MTMATVAELQDRARELDISGRSSMNKGELEDAIAEAEKSTVADVSGDAPADSVQSAPKTKRAKEPPLAWLGEITPTHTGRSVLAAQILLREHGLQVGALDGIAGREFTRAVRRFRSEHGLPESDRVDAAAWAALAAPPT